MGAGNVGLRVNTRKTIITKIRIDETSQIYIQGDALQGVEKFVYLGCEMSVSYKTCVAVCVAVPTSQTNLYAKFGRNLSLNLVYTHFLEYFRGDKAIFQSPKMG